MMVGRLREGASLAQAETELVAIAGDVAAEFPRSNTGWSVALIPFRDLLLGDVQGSMRTLIYALAGAVSLLLIIACVNGAHLFLARCLEQEREIALASALGASRTDIFRQLFLEGWCSRSAPDFSVPRGARDNPRFMASSRFTRAYHFFRSIGRRRRLALALGASF
jgi:hypothetical protein